MNLTPNMHNLIMQFCKICNNFIFLLCWNKDLSSKSRGWYSM